jgi:putative transposase
LASVAANVLDRNFNPDEPNQAWVSDITYVRTYEGFLYVAYCTGSVFSTHRGLVDG